MQAQARPAVHTSEWGGRQGQRARGQALTSVVRVLAGIQKVDHAVALAAATGRRGAGRR